MKYVYAIGPANGPFKVGIAANVRNRLSGIQTGCPFPVSVHVAAISSDARRDEARLHSLLDQYRLTGEWFSAALNVVMDAFGKIGLVEMRDEHPQIAEPATALSATGFNEWIEAMAARPFFYSEQQCADGLGVSGDDFDALKREGTDKRTALACRALLHRLPPYGA